MAWTRHAIEQTQLWRRLRRPIDGARRLNFDFRTGSQTRPRVIQPTSGRPAHHAARPAESPPVHKSNRRAATHPTHWLICAQVGEARRCRRGARAPRSSWRRAVRRRHARPSRRHNNRPLQPKRSRRPRPSARSRSAGSGARCRHGVLVRPVLAAFDAISVRADTEAVGPGREAAPRQVWGEGVPRRRRRVCDLDRQPGVV